MLLRAGDSDSGQKGIGLLANERRHADRAAVQLEATVVRDGKTLSCLLGNLGPAGAFIETGENLRVGECVGLSFPLLPFRSGLNVEAEVRWKKGGEKAGVGVHFKELRELDQLAIHDYVLILLAKRRHRQYEK